MDVIKIIGVGLISLIIVIVLKQYKPEYAIYASIIAGVLILLLVMDKLTRNNKYNKVINKQGIYKFGIYKFAYKNNWNCISFRICCKHM